jgi:hypothetical protein
MFDKLGKIGAFSKFIPQFGISMNVVEQIRQRPKKHGNKSAVKCRQMLRFWWV